MECTTSSLSAGRQAVSLVEAAIGAVALPLMRMTPRSTAEQREAYLEQLYTEYAELQSQREEIDNRKRVMDFEMYQSNQQDIHDLLFANVDAADGALGDWDTWESVEAVVKRYAYGKPRHTAQEKKELGAMQSRIDALNEVLQEKAATVQSLTASLDAAHEEVAGVRRLLQLKDNEVRMLSNQNNTAKLQLRCVQRECAALRNLCSEEPSALKDDIRFLIEANKELERQNLEMRRFLNAHDDSAGVACTHRTLLKEKAVDPSLIDDEASEPTSSGVTDDTLDLCLKDDAYRHKLLYQGIPFSGMYIDAKRNIDLWKRRVEAEVSCAMEMLDRDALLAHKMLPPPVDRGGAQWSPPKESSAFVSYATYQSANEMQPSLKRIDVVSAPQLPAFASALPAPPQRVSEKAVGDAAKVVSTRTETPASHVAAPESREQQESRKDRKLRSTVHPSRSKKTVASTGGAATPATTRKTATPASASTSEESDTAHKAPGCRTLISTRAAAFMQLKSTVLQCAELSRANALRRELLHTQWLRQQLQEQHDRAASVTEVQSRYSSQDATVMNTHDTSAPLGELGSAANTGNTQLALSTTVNTDTRLSDTLHRRESSSSTSTAYRLRHLVQESRPPTGVTDGVSGEVEGCRRDGTPNSGRLAISPSRPSGSPSRNLSVRSSLTRRNLPAQTMNVGYEGSDTGRIRTELGVHHPSTLLSEASAPTSADAATLTQFRTEDSRGTVVAQFANRLALHAKGLRQDVQQLALDAASFRSEVHEALQMFGTLLVQQQLHYQHPSEAETFREANAAMQGALEEAAVARTAHLLEQKFNLKLAQDCYTASPASVPETATDAEWLAHELRVAALAMIRETVRAQAICADGSQQDDVDAAAQAAASAALRRYISTEAKKDGAGLAHRFYDDDILGHIQAPPKGTFGTARRWNMPRAGSHGDYSGVVDGGREDADVDTTDSCGQDAYAGQRSSRRALPPMQWYWKADNGFSAPLTGAATRRTLMKPKRLGGGFGAASFAMPTPLPWCSSPADIELIRPTVFRYDFGAAGRQAQQQVNAQMKRGMAFICGKGFYEFVREYVVPIISTAARVKDGACMDDALRTAVRELREKARRRCKRGVRLLLDRVANNIRTRHLLRSGVFHGEGFVSYVGLLYNKWRNTVELERRLLRAEQRHGLSSLMSLMHFQTPASDALATTPPFLEFSERAPAGEVTGDRYCTSQHQLQKSSYHFDKVNFQRE